MTSRDMTPVGHDRVADARGNRAPYPHGLEGFEA